MLLYMRLVSIVVHSWGSEVRGSSEYDSDPSLARRILRAGSVSPFCVHRDACALYRGLMKSRTCTSKDNLTKGRGFNESIKTKTKQNKTNITPEKDVMTSANQTPRGHKFAPLVTSQQGRANQHEHACFGLSSPWSFPSRSGIPLHAVVQPWFFLRRFILP